MINKALYGYFDYAAATPMLPAAAEAMRPYLNDNFYNASALYLSAKKNRSIIEGVRHEIAKGLGAKPLEIVFTAGGTEANNLAIHGIMQKFPDAHMIASAIEHDSVLSPASKYDHSIVQVDKNGFVSLEAIKKAVKSSTVLISVMYANNEIGTIEPIHEISKYIEEQRKIRKQNGNTYPLYLHTDACQATNYLDLQVSRLGVDLLSINAGKMYGPKQCGALFIKTGIALMPLLQGGGQEWNLRSGTENISAIVAFGVSWKEVRGNYQKEADRVTQLRNTLVHDLLQRIPGCSLNGPKEKKRIANNVHITIKDIDNERLLMELDELGFMVASGSACNASNDEPSHVLKAIGLNDEQARSSIRITLGKYTESKAIHALVDNILQNIPKK